MMDKKTTADLIWWLRLQAKKHLWKEVITPSYLNDAAERIEDMQAALEYADNKLYMLEHTEKAVSSALMVDVRKARQRIEKCLQQKDAKNG